MGLFDALFNFIGNRRAKKKVNERLEQIKADRLAGAGAGRGPQRRRLDLPKTKQQVLKEAREGAERLLTNPLSRYLFKGEPVTDFESSCVKMFWYDIYKRVLHIQFKDKYGVPGGTYAYGVRMGSITPEAAASLWRSKSKGSWVWDNLRIRGTKLGHQVDYILELSPAGGMKWEQTAESAEAHAQQVAFESNYDVYERFERERPDQNIGRGEPEMRAPRSRKARDNRDPRTGKIRLPD